MAESWFVERADGKIDGPFHERQISADLLGGKIDDSLRIRQGSAGPWCPASRARVIFQQLADEGWYVRTGDTTFGPFMPERLLELSRKGELRPESEVRQGTSSQWKPAERVLSLWRAQKAPSVQDVGAVATSSQPTAAEPAVASNPVASPAKRAKWSTEPIRHYRIALESVLPAVKLCVANERLLLAKNESQPEMLVVNRANGKRIGLLSSTNSQQLLLNCQRGSSHVVLFSENANPEVAIIICPPGTVAEDCKHYIEANFRKDRAPDVGFPNIKV